MKKITLFLFLLTVSFGYSQTFPLDFTDPLDLFSNNGSNPTITTDPGDSDEAADPSNNVMQIDGAGGTWDNVKLVLAQRVDLSDTNNNTITFRMKAITDLGARSHLLKFESGANGSATAEVGFSTVAGTEWQNFSLDFDASTPGGPGDYADVIIFTDAGSNNTGVYLIDDIAGGTNLGPSCTDGVMNQGEEGIDCGGPCPNECPMLPPPAPSPATPAANVYNIYSDTGGYSGGFTYNQGCFGAVAGEPDLDTGAGTNLAWEMDFAAQGFGCGQNPTFDASGMTFVSFQYYTDNANDFYIDLISDDALPNSRRAVVETFYYIGQNAAGGAPAADEAIVTGAWTHVIIPMSHFTNQGFVSTNFFQFKFDVFSVQGPGTVYIDNVLLSNVTPTLGVNDFEISDFNVYPNPSQDVWNIKSSNQNITSVQVFDILGKNVLSLTPNSTAAKVDASGLNAGLYFAKVNSDNGTKTIKLIKQ